MVDLCLTDSGVCFTVRTTSEWGKLHMKSRLWQRNGEGNGKDIKGTESHWLKRLDDRIWVWGMYPNWGRSGIKICALYSTHPFKVWNSIKHFWASSVPCLNNSWVASGHFFTFFLLLECVKDGRPLIWYNLLY